VIATANGSSIHLPVSRLNRRSGYAKMPMDCTCTVGNSQIQEYYFKSDQHGRTKRSVEAWLKLESINGDEDHPKLFYYITPYRNKK